MNTAEELIAEAVSILETIRHRITDSSDLTWVSFDDAAEFRQDIDRCISGINARDIGMLEAAHAHFLPSFDFQQHALQNDWSEEYNHLSARFDHVYAALKQMIE